MPEEIPEKSFREWLAEALAQDEKTWEALEEKGLRCRISSCTALRARDMARTLSPEYMIGQVNCCERS